MSNMKTTLAQMHRDTYRKRVQEIAAKAGARLLLEYKEPESGVTVLIYWSNNKSIGQVIVRIDEDSCYHYPQGGGLWSDLERDMGAPDGK